MGTFYDINDCTLQEHMFWIIPNYIIQFFLTHYPTQFSYCLSLSVEHILLHFTTNDYWYLQSLISLHTLILIWSGLIFEAKLNSVDRFSDPSHWANSDISCLASQSRPSCKPLPECASQANIFQVLPQQSLWRASCSVRASTLRALGRSWRKSAMF